MTGEDENSVAQLPLPKRSTPAQILGHCLRNAGDAQNAIVLIETESGLLEYYQSQMLPCEALWMLENARQVLLRPDENEE